MTTIFLFFSAASVLHFCLTKVLTQCENLRILHIQSFLIDSQQLEVGDGGLVNQQQLLNAYCQ